MISVSLFYETVLITIVTIVLHSIYSGMPLFLRHHHSYIPPRSFCTSISKYCVFHIHYLYWVACLYFYNTILTIAAIFTTPFSPSPTFLQHHSHHRRHFYNTILTIADIFHLFPVVLLYLFIEILINSYLLLYIMSLLHPLFAGVGRRDS